MVGCPPARTLVAKDVEELRRGDSQNILESRKAVVSSQLSVSSKTPKAVASRQLSVVSKTWKAAVSPQ